MKLRLVVPFLVALLAFGGSAHADATATAEDLFQRAKALIAQNKWTDACPLLAESYRLDPAGGTLQNLAVCYESSGRWASAVARFQELKNISKAATPPRADRIKLAEEHLAKISAKVSHLVLTLPNDVASTAEVHVDGVAYQRTAWSVGIAVDPGAHEISVVAPGKKPFKTDVMIPNEAKDEKVTVSLEAIPPPPPPTPAVDVRGPSDDGRAEERAESERATRRTGYIVGGAGLLAVGGGMVFGALAIGKNNDGKDACSDPSNAGKVGYDAAGRCVSGEQPLRDANDEKSAARTFGTVSTILTGVGLVAVGVGVYFAFIRGKSAATLRIGPTIGGAFAEGTF